MAVRNFDGAADLLVCSIGGLASVDGGANTYAALIKVTTTKDQGVMNVHDSAAAQHQGLVLLSVSGDIGYQSGLGGQDIALAVPTATWGVAVVTKASGTSTPRGHWCVLGGANTHTNAGGTVADYGANDLAGGSVRFGGAGFGDYDGRIAAAGILNSVLSDADIESLKTSWANWVSLFTGANAALYRFDQASTSDPVNDQTGNGANQTSLTGTTVVTGDDPPGFDWGAADASWQPNPLSVVRYKIPALRGLRTFTSELTTVPPSATGAATGEQHADDAAGGVKGAIGATQSGTRTSGASTGVKGAAGASTGQQRTTDTTAAAKQATGVAVGPQRSSGQPAGKKNAFAAAAGQQHSLGAATGVKTGVGAATGPVRSTGVAGTAVAVVIVPGRGVATVGTVVGTAVPDTTTGTARASVTGGTAVPDATAGVARVSDTDGKVTVG